MSLKPHVYWTFYHMFSICCITISFWVVTKVVVKPSFELKRVRWRRKFARLMRFFEIDVAECNLKPSIKRFKTLGIQKLLLAHTISYIFPWKLLFTSWEWVQNDTWKKISEVSFMLRAWRLPAFCLPCENQVQTWHVSKCLVIRNLLHSLDGKEELG